MLSDLVRRRWFIALVVLLVVIAVGLRFLNAGLMHYDSVRLAQTVESNLKTGEFHGISAGGRYGMVIVTTLVYAPFYLAGQDADFAVRLTGVLMLALSAMSLFLLMFEMSRSRLGSIAAAFLLAATPLFLMPSTYGKEHSTAVFFLVLACFCALRGHRSRALLWPIAASSLFVLSLTVRELFIVALPAFLWFLLLPRLRRVDGRWRVLMGAQWTAGALFLIVILGAVLLWFLGGQLRAVSGDSAVSSVFLSWRYLVSGFWDLTLNTPFMWPFFLVGVYAVWRLGRDYLLPLFLWLAPFVFIVGLGGYTPRYLDVILVPFVIVVAFSIAWVSERWLVLAVAVMLFLVLGTFFTALPFLEARHRADNLKDFSLYVANVTEPDAVIVAGDESAFIDYYAKRKGESMSPDPANKFALARWILDLQNNGTPLYVLQSSFDYPGGDMLRDFIKYNFNAEIVGSHVMENYHVAENSIFLRNVSIIRIEGPFFNASRMEEYEREWESGNVTMGSTISGPEDALPVKTSNASELAGVLLQGIS